MSHYTPSTVQPNKLYAPDLPADARIDPRLGLDACPWLDQYLDFSRKWSPRSYDGYHEGVALWILSTIATRRVAVSFGGLHYTNLYILLVGRTTLQAKSTAMEIGRDLLQHVGLDFLLLPSDTTPQKMMNEMSGSLPANYGTLSAEQKDRTKLMLAFAGQRGWLYDEFGRNIQAMMRTDGPHAEFRGLLRQFDDTPPYLDRATIVRGIERVERPYLALLGALTPADLVAVAARSSTLWGDGYLARMAFIIPPAELIKDDRFPKEQRQISPDLMQPLIDWHRRLGIPPVKVESGILSRPGPSPLSIVSVDDDVFEAQYAYTGALLKMLPSLPTDFDGNYGRFGAKAIRIATLLASVGGSSSIKLNHWARAQEITERFRQNLHELYRQVNDTAVVHKPMDALDKVKKALLEKPFPTKREIEQYTGLPGTVVASLLDELLTAEKVICEQSGKTYRYRRASQAG